MTLLRPKEWVETQEKIENGMDAINNAIEKNKDNKEVLWVAYNLFNRWIDMELNQYSQIDDKWKDKIKVVLWNNLIENLSLTWSLKAWLNSFASKFSDIWSMFSVDEELSEESQKTWKGFIYIEWKFKDTPAWELMTFLKEKIWEGKFQIIWNIDKLNKENQDKLFNNIDWIENVFKKWLKKWEKLEDKINSLPKSEIDFTNYINETIKDTNNRWKTLWKFKKIWDKILWMAEKFWFKDSLVSMLDMLYKIPGIWAILKMLFAPKIKANFDKVWLNGPEWESIFNLKEFTNKKENKDILGFNPSDKLSSEWDEKEWKDNPDKLKKEDLIEFYSKFGKYFEDEIRASWKTDEKEIKKEAKKLSKKLITSDAFWSGILTWKKWEKLEKSLNSNEQILALIFKNLWWKEGIKILDKSTFLSKLNSLDLPNLVATETENKDVNEANQKEIEEKEKIRLAKEVEYRKHNTNLDDFLKTNDNTLDFKLEIKKEEKKPDIKDNKVDGKKETEEKTEKLKENEISEKTFFNFYNEIEKYNDALKPEEKISEIKLDKDFWVSILTGENSSWTKLPENNILNLLYLEFKDKKSKNGFEWFLKSLTNEKIASLSLERTLDNTKKGNETNNKKKVAEGLIVAETTKKIWENKDAIKNPKTEAEIKKTEKIQEEARKSLKLEIKKINEQTIPNIDTKISTSNLEISNLKDNKSNINSNIESNKAKIDEIEKNIDVLREDIKKDNFYINSIYKYFNLKTNEEENIEVLREDIKKIKENNNKLKIDLNKIESSIIKKDAELNSLRRKLLDSEKELLIKKEKLKEIPAKTPAK